MNKEIIKLQAALAAAEAENQRYDLALQEVMSYVDNWDYDSRPQDLYDIAENALAAQQEAMS